LSPSVQCPYCRAPALLCTGTQVYPHRPDLRHKLFYRCEPCRAWVGCHPNTTTALGRLANAELRAAKQRVHAVFDPHWRSAGNRTRSKAYARLASELEIPASECHVGMFDVAMCERAIAVITTWRTPCES